MEKLLNLVLQNKSVESKSETPSPDPKDLWVLFMILTIMDNSYLVQLEDDKSV